MLLRGVSVNKKRRCSYLLVLVALTTLYTASAAAPGDGGEVVSTSLTVNNQAFGDIVANKSLFYYWNGTMTKHTTEGNTPEDIQPFARVDLVQDGGYVLVEIGENNTLPESAKLLIDDDRTPNLNNSLDENQIQIEGNGTASSEIIYSGINNTNRIYYEGDGEVYVFLNTGDAARGNIKVDIKLTV